MQSAEANYKGVWGNRIGFGQRPALLVIDFLKGYTIKGSPLYAPGVVDAVARTPHLIEAARRTGIPVIHTRILFLAENCADGGIWVQNAPVMKAMVEGNELEISFNAKYLIDVLSQIDQPQVVLETTQNTRPGTLRPVGMGEDEFLHVVMPMHPPR